MKNQLLIKILLLTGLLFGFSPAISAIVHHSGELTTDEIWSASDVHVIDSFVIVPSGLSLTIEPGTVLKFSANAGLTIDGVLNAAGTQAAPIVFTSIRDDSVGGDTNGDGDATVPAAGDWYYLSVNGTESDDIELQYLDMRYGGGYSSWGMLRLNRTSVTVRNSSIRHSRYEGIYVEAHDAHPIIADSIITDNGRPGVYFRNGAGTLTNNEISRNGQHGVSGSYMTLTITGNRINQNGGHGIHGDRSVATIADNEIKDNGDWGLYFSRPGAMAPITGNTITGNAFPLYLPFSALPVEADGNTIAGNTGTLWRVHGNSRSASLTLDSQRLYWFSGNATLASGATLTIEPGTVLKFDPAASLNIDGVLNAAGTQAAPIVFTSIKDDSVGGDTNGDGDTPVPAAGNWHHLSVNGTESDGTELQYLDMRYGGHSSWGMLYLNGASVTVRNSSIRHSRYDGIYVEAHGTHPIIADSIIIDNGRRGVYFRDGAGTLTNNEISRNGQHGVSGSRTTLTITGNRINQNGGHGIHGDRLVATIADNEIKDNGDWGLYFSRPGAMAPITGNTITGNAFPLYLPFSALPVEADGNTIAGNAGTLWRVHGNSRSASFTLDSQRQYWFSGNATLASGATLTIEPGTILKFDLGASLNIDGVLNAAGTQAAPIVFTSIKDDSVGGDTNGDGDASVPAAGDWYYLSVNGTESDGTELQYLDMRYGGYSSRGMLCLNGASVTVRNSSIRHSRYEGIYAGAHGAHPTIADSIITDNGRHGVHFYRGAGTLTNNEISRNGQHGVSGSRTTLTITGNRINQNGGHGIYGNNSTAEIADNELMDNGGWGLYFSQPGAMAPITGNTITGNAFPLYLPFSALPVEADGNTIAGNAGTLWRIHGNSRSASLTLDSQRLYWFSGNATLASGATLTIEPGTVLKFDPGASLNIYGVLNAVGTQAAPIVFTSIKDDSVGGDTNGDGSSNGWPGDWSGIDLRGGGASTLSFVDIRYMHLGVYLNGSTVDIDNSVIASSSVDGIQIFNGGVANISHSALWGHGRRGAYISSSTGAISIDNTEISSNGVGLRNQNCNLCEINNGWFYGNTTAGIDNNDTDPVNAQNAWWGDVDGSGPYEAVNNPGGTGDEIQGNVDYSGYLTVPPIDFSYTNFSAQGVSGQGTLPIASLHRGMLSDEWDTNNFAPEKTMVWDADAVEIGYAGLDPNKNYKIRIRLYDADAGYDPRLRITNDKGLVIAPRVKLVNGIAGTLEYPLPVDSYAQGEIRLLFVNDTDAAVSQSRVSLSEIWLLENNDLTANPAQVIGVDYNDRDGSRGLTIGDEFHFHFSQPMSPATLADDSTDANEKLILAGGRVYGASNAIRWSENGQTAIVSVTGGYTLTGSETVTVEGLRDAYGNLVNGTLALSLVDTVDPVFESVDWIDVDSSHALSLGDQFVFHFSEAMDVSVIPDGSNRANRYLSPGGRSYGTVNAVSWSSNAHSLTVNITDGYSLWGNELVNPSDHVVDVAGNATDEVRQLTAIDTDPPSVIGVYYSDLDGDSALSVGDLYRFQFSEVMNTGAIRNGTDDANVQLNPESLRYGVVNSTQWNANDTELVVYLTDGFTITGTELVTPGSGLTDRAGNALDNSFYLTTQDEIAPQLLSVTMNQPNPTRYRSDIQLILQFDSAMDVAMQPVVSLSGPVASPVVGAGTWSTSQHPNDTYTTAAIAFEQTHVGSWQVAVSAAQDNAGNLMEAVNNAFAVTITDLAFRVTNYSAAPHEHVLATPDITVQGRRDDQTSIWLNGTEAVALGSDDWSIPVTLAEGSNTLVLEEKDADGVLLKAITLLFNLDRQAPAAPVIGAYPVNTTASVISLTGTKEADTSLWRDGAQIQTLNGQTTWSFSQSLALGTNTHVLLVKDQAGNASPEVSYTITREEVVESPPVLSDLVLDAQALTNGMVVSKSGRLGVAATSDVGIGKVEFYIDADLLATDSNGADGYHAYWNLHDIADGAYNIIVRATSTTGLTSELSVSVTVALSVPAPPQISAPQDGLVTSNPQQTVTGRAESLANIRLYVNDQLQMPELNTNAQGDFSGAVVLVDGDNRLQASAFNRAGESEKSVVVNLTLDRSLPSTPMGLTATALESGRISLRWLPVAGDIAGYNVYRHTAAFTTKAEARRVNPTLVTGAAFEDIPPADGTYYYRVSAVNVLDTEGELSDIAHASIDTGLPRALDILYTPQGNYDPVTGRYAQGRVDIALLVSEPLLTTPFLSWAVDGGSPITAVLEKFSDTEYRGHMNITPAAGNGTAYAVFSARDLAGNRGTVIDNGGQIEIDTKGPDVLNVQLTPAHPIRNDQANPVSVDIVMQLDEAIASGQLPQLELQFPLSGTMVSVNNFNSSDQQSWQGSVILPAEAGRNAPELLLYRYSGVDDLGNESTRVLDTRRPQVYQGELPPLDVPAQCLVEVLPAGEVRVTWAAVEEASDYQIFRRAPGEALLSAYDLSGGQLVYQEAPGVDGAYEYAVASVRIANGETALSAPCEAQSVEVDSGVPPAPTGLALALVGAGVEAIWTHPGVDEPVTYRLYRSDATPIADPASLTPVVSGITELWAVDTRPVSGQFYYAVTAVDAAGNESPPSNTAYLNFELLPVNRFSITQMLDQPPRLSWAHPSATIDHYDLYLGDPALGYRLNDSGLLDGAYTDTAAQPGQERLYAVVAVDDTGAQSPARSLLLPRLVIALDENTMLKRGIMNRIAYTLSNQGQHNIYNAQLTVLADGKEHSSASFDLPAGQTKVVTVVVGGYQALPDSAMLQTHIDIHPRQGEHVRLVREYSVPVTDAGLTIGLAVKDMVRGTQGKVRFTLENSSDVELQVITARASGSQPSDEVVLKLLGEDDNVLSTAALRQFLGPVVTLSNGVTVARISPGESFTSDWIPLFIPQSTPDQVAVQLDVAALHYEYGKASHVRIAGVSGRRNLPLVDTPYYGVLDSVTPRLSHGERAVTLTGRALVRADDSALAYSPLNLVLSLRGFERVIEVMTGEDGRFSHAFEPEQNETGIFKVAVVHPELVERPEQGRFTVAGLHLQYDSYRLTTARNFDQPVALRVTASEGASFHKLRFALLAEDQPSGFLPVGIALTPGVAIDLGAEETATLSMIIRADAAAPENGEFILRVVSDETPSIPLDTLRVTYRLVDAAPRLRFTPDSLGTGVAPGDVVGEVVTLINQGLLPAENVQLSLINNDGLSWVRMDTPATIAELSLGEEYAISLSFAPDANVADGVYNLGIEARSGGVVLAVLGIQVTVSSAGEGQLLFKVEDIYTGTRDSNGAWITGLAGARIALQHELLSTVRYEFTSGDDGEVLSTAMKAGSYRYRATAPDRVEATGRVMVRAGVVTPQRLFLDTNVVTVEWSVTETTIEDLYNITLTATYAVDVPTAVIVLEPAGISLPYLKAGDVYYGELTLTNYGLIRADNLQLILPPEDAYLRVEALADNLPTSLDAKQRIVIPYRITAIKNLEANATGGGCFNYSTRIKAEAESVCANGDVVNRTTSTTIAHQSGGSCSSGGGSGGSGGGWGGGGSGGGGGYDIEPSGFPACRPECQGCCPMSGRGGQ